MREDDDDDDDEDEDDDDGSMVIMVIPTSTFWATSSRIRCDAPTLKHFQAGIGTTKLTK